MRDPSAQRAAWRSSLASLAQACADDLPSPLDGLAPGKIVDSVRAALNKGLIDDLDWLSSASAGAALYEVAAALPSGHEKRELGRRVLARLLEGDAGAFVALATRMALGSGKGLGGEAVRARVALAVALPARLGVRVEPLAFALVSRRELAREWVGAAATGSLADRRMAGRLLEQAARAVVRRVAEGDERALSAFRGEAASQAWRRLLEDREPAVWRHVAVARGLLAGYAPQHLDAIEQGLRPGLSPTEWRRAATSAVALGAARPEMSHKLIGDALRWGLLKRDPGSVSAMLWGLPAAAEVEPDIADGLLSELSDHADPLLLAEALSEILPYGPGGDFGQDTLRKLRDVLAKMAPVSTRVGGSDDGAVALRAHIAAELRPRDQRERSSRELLIDGMQAFAEQGARPAFQVGLEALAMVEGGLATLEALSDNELGSALSRRTAFSALRDIEGGLLEDGLLFDLLVLGARSPEAQRAAEGHEACRERLARWLVEREQQPSSRNDAVPHRTLRLGRLRAILRLADVRLGDESVETPAAQATRARGRELANLMLRHLVTRPPQVLHRTICAAFARAVDSLLRDEGLDPADVLLVVAQRGLSPDDLSTVVEASMNGDLRSALKAFLELLAAIDAIDNPAVSDPDEPSSIPPAVAVSLTATVLSSAGASRKVDALMAFTRGIEVDTSSRIEALRAALTRLGRALGRILAASSLAAIAGKVASEASPVRDLEGSLEAIAQFVSGARQRFSDRQGDGLRVAPSLSLASALDSVLRGADTDDLVFAVASAREELSLSVPPFLVEIVGAVLDTLLTLPLQAESLPAPAPVQAEIVLPPWMPRRRTLGGFYVVRPLGSGAGGTVFVARRIEDRNNEAAEHFALKVPDYDGNAARSLSEVEFMQLFREEATALLGLPRHTNLAQFITFDLASRPKPILVMEMVEGLSLERLMGSGKVEVARVFDILDGVLAGLEAMHSAGIGHLDVKPSNVILRDNRVPVLVDFGLSGRHIRRGCATLPYGAPEVWDETLGGSDPVPMPVDIYAFACMAFELLTTHDLFDGPDEMAIIASHLKANGWPGPLNLWAREQPTRPLADVLSQALRRNPKERLTAPQMRAHLRDARKPLLDRPWPLRLG